MPPDQSHLPNRLQILFIALLAALISQITHEWTHAIAMLIVGKTSKSYSCSPYAVALLSINPRR